MDPFWGVVIGLSIGGLLRELYLWYKQFKTRHEGRFVAFDAKWPAVLSLVFGFVFFIPFGSLIGLWSGVVGYKNTKYRKLSVLGIILCILGTLFWIMLVVQKFI